MKKDVVSRVAKWLESNGVYDHIANGKENNISTDGYTIYSDEELGASISVDNGKRYNFRIQSCEIGHGGTSDVYSAGVRIFPLYIDSNGKCARDLDGKIEFSTTPTQNSLEDLGKWFEKNTSFKPFPKFRSTDFEDGIKDFIYKVDNSKTLKIESGEYATIGEFFKDKSIESYTSNASIVVVAIDKNIPIVKLEKQMVGKSKKYKFIVEIKTEKNDEFIVRSTIDTKEKFYNLLEATINSLREFKEFSKYASELSKCI